jgi:hypothetical protein
VERGKQIIVGKQHRAERRFERRAQRAAGARSLHRGSGA